MLTIPDRVAERVLTKVVMGPRGCHVSTYSVGTHGYAQVGWTENGASFGTTAHVVAWVGIYGEGAIPSGLTLDHVECQNRRCINVAHLRLLTGSQNAARHGGRDWPLDECANGHKLGEYWHRPDGAEKGHCRACRRDVDARYVPTDEQRAQWVANARERRRADRENYNARQNARNAARREEYNARQRERRAAQKARQATSA